MKYSIFAILTVIFGLKSYGQCDTLTLEYQVDHLERESRRNEIYFTNVPEDSLQINFNTGFDYTRVTVIIEGVKMTLNKSTDESLGYTGTMRFKRPISKSPIELIFKGSQAYIEYNEKYNMIHIWSSDCNLTVRHTNRMITYE